MKLFVLNANVEFEAEDIDDALAKLSAHFRALTEDQVSELLTRGEVTVEPKAGSDKADAYRSNMD